MKKLETYLYIVLIVTGMLFLQTGAQSMSVNAFSTNINQSNIHDDSVLDNNHPFVVSPTNSSLVSSGVNYYVSAAGGNDSNPGTESAPWRTIQKAADTMASADTVTVEAGNYPEAIELDKSNIRFVASGKVIMEGFSIAGDHNLISGFTITNPDSEYGIQVTGNNNLIENNEIYRTKQDGIWFFGHDNIFRDNYLHDILDPSVPGDPHVDCFQTWGSNWETYNILFEKNICNHTRTSGSNQIIMLENKSAYTMRNITFQNNIFIMHYAGNSALNLHRKAGQAKISNINVFNNTFYNVTLKGIEAVKFSGISSGTLANNVSIGYTRMVAITNGSIVVVLNNVQSGPYGMVDYQNFDFHLTDFSLLINAGANIPVMDDFDGLSRPQGGKHDIGAFESLSAGPTFTDVPFSHPLVRYIEALYDAGYTTGCSTSPLMYCPDTILNRAQSAVFMLRGQLGVGYTPPPAPWNTFADNWSGLEWAEPWAEGMWKEGFTAGCKSSPLMYCPSTQLPRVEASVFGLRMKYGVNYIPPAGTGTLFADMTDKSYWGIGWAEKAYQDGLLPACGTDGHTGKPLFCPSMLVNRAWGAYLIVMAKNIPLP